MRKIITLLAAVLLALTACSVSEDAAQEDKAVMATVYPLYIIFDNVAGDSGHSRGTLLPPSQGGSFGVLTDNDRAVLDYTALLIAIGSESYFDELSVDFPDLQVVAVGGSASCPWTSVQAYMNGVMTVTEALCEWDPENEGLFRQNADAYLTELTELHALYTRMLSNVAGQQVVLFGDAFEPLFADYGLEAAALVTVGEDGEMTAQSLAGIVQTCREEDVQMLVVDDQSDPAAAEAVSAQTGIPVVQLVSMLDYDAENTNDREEYVRIMEENLNKIAQILIWDKQ